MIETQQATITLLENQHEFAESLRAKYPDCPGNTINYITNLALSFWQQDQDFAVYEVAENLQTAIVEKVEADITGVHEYVLTTAVAEDGITKVRFGQGWAEDIYTNAIDENNSQLPLFEIKRNQANLSNLHKIQEQANQEKPSQFVEFSPSPKLTPEAQERGYDGRDSVFIYSIGQDGQIKVKQHWFGALDLQEYDLLLKDLGLSESAPCDDLELMSKSFVVQSDEQLSLLDGFIAAKSTVCSEQSKAILAPQIDQIFARCLNQILDLKDWARSLLMYPDLDIHETLDALADFIHSEQLGLRYALWQKGLNTFSEQIGEYLNTVNPMVTGFPAMLKSLYTADGCGFKIKGGSSGFGHLLDALSIPKSTLLVSFTGPSLERPDASKCDICLQVFYVKNGDVSTYFEACPHCNSRIEKCA